MEKLIEKFKARVRDLNSFLAEGGPLSDYHVGKIMGELETLERVIEELKLMAQSRDQDS